MDSADRATPPEVSTTEPSQTPSLTEDTRFSPDYIARLTYAIECFEKAHNTVSPNMQEKVKQATTLGKELSEDMEKWFSVTAKLREKKEEQDKKIDSFVKRRDEFSALRVSESAKIVPGIFSPYMENVDFRVGQALKEESELLIQEDAEIKKKEEENRLLRQHCNDKKVIFDQLMDEIMKMAIESEQTDQDMQSLLAACPWKSHVEESIHVGDSNSRDDDSPSASDQPTSSRSG